MTTTSRLISLAAEIAWRQAEFSRLKQAVAQSSEGVTVYAVRETTVRRHRRAGYRAVRVQRPKTD